MVQTLAWVLGAILTLFGVLGFVPGVTTGGMLLGVFQVSAFLSIVHIVTGLTALAAAWGIYCARLYFQILSGVYALAAILGLVQGSYLGLFDLNLADNLLHLVIALLAFYAGFMRKKAIVLAPTSAGMGASM